MLIVETPPTYIPERKYITELLLGHFLGIEYKIRFRERKDVCISGPDKKSIHLIDVFFQTPEDKWLTQDSLPHMPLSTYEVSDTFLKKLLVNPCLPVVFSDPRTGALLSGNVLTIDIFGSAFFLLSRYEEIVNDKKDILRATWANMDCCGDSLCGDPKKFREVRKGTVTR